jgi:hypothetical protein
MVYVQTRLSHTRDGLNNLALALRRDCPTSASTDLRHTAAILQLSRGLHPKVVREMLEHADITITLRVDALITPILQQAAAAVVDDLFAILPARDSCVLHMAMWPYNAAQMRTGWHQRWHGPSSWEARISFTIRTRQCLRNQCAQRLKSIETRVL